MTRSGPRGFLFVLGLLAVAAQAAAADPCLEQARQLARSESGLGGTGLADEGGIGGTGLFDEGGIGGTGFGDEGGIGGTGIFGTLTGFGSLCVNGLRVELGPDVAVELRGAPAGVDALGVGHVVWIEATARSGALRAEKIRVFSAAQGVVTEVDAVRRRLRVGAQWALLPTRTAFFDAAAGRALALAELGLGDFVDVSGLFAPDGSLVASRVERRPPAPLGRVGIPALSALLAQAPELARVSLESFLAERTAARRLRIDGLEVELAPDLGPPQLASSARVWIEGRPGADGRLRAERVFTLGPPALPELPSGPSLVPDPPRIEPPEPRDDASPEPSAVVPTPADDWSELDLFGDPFEKPVSPPDRVEPAEPTPTDPVERPVLPRPVAPPTVVPAPIDPAPLDRAPSIDVRR